MRSRIGLTTTALKAGHDPNQILIKLALREALLGCESVLDVGCGISPTMRQLGISQTVGAEGYAPSFMEAKRQNTHDQLVQCDVRELSKQFQPRQFDACVALDVIEHLTKPDGLKLIADMEKIARKRVVFFTPSGFLPQHHASNDDLQEHLSGWNPEEMEQLGYRVIGLLRPKSLRGEYHRLKRRPDFFWGLVSLAGQCFWSKYHPQAAAAILCVKKISGG
ncbi:MAG TPA: SAM-dependent methyltransferase [Verrucomicrobia subdivision 3 bacterium]|nr:SAM-dependent methyltransferase [Limisphaerales bacterium]